MLRRAYSAMLGLYPEGFRKEFRDEMLSVFDRAAAANRNRLLFGVRELASLAAGAMRARTASPRPHPEGEMELPSDAAGLERFIENTSTRVVTAIARHDFAGARYYDLQDRRARSLLAQLRAR